jgi:hypothetical protein
MFSGPCIKKIEANFKIMRQLCKKAVDKFNMEKGFEKDVEVICIF